MQNALELKIYATWDAEASVWFATSDDVPGLATEAGTMEELYVKLRVMVPELLQENDGSREPQGRAPIDLLVQSRERLCANG